MQCHHIALKNRHDGAESDFWRLKTHFKAKNVDFYPWKKHQKVFKFCL